MKKQDKQKRRNKRFTRHHLCPKERVKNHTETLDMSDNEFVRILILTREHHDYWHFLFHNLTLEEIISVLQRIKKMKGVNSC